MLDAASLSQEPLNMKGADAITWMYISKVGMGDVEVCIRTLFKIRDSARAVLAEGSIRGFVLQTFYSAEDIEKESLPVEPVVKACAGTFPVNWVALSRLELQPHVVLDEFQREYQLELIGTFLPVRPTTSSGNVPR